VKRYTLPFSIILEITLMLGGINAAAQAADPILGTWVLNVAKSKFTSGPAPKSESRTYVMEGQETRLTSKDVSEPRRYVSVRQEIKAKSERVGDDGSSTTVEWTIVYDGRDRPVSGDVDAETLSMQRLDALTTKFTQKRAGSSVIVGTVAISRDGRVMTITTQGINVKGQPIDDVLVFDKQ
jgi:hypothetical protein